MQARIDRIISLIFTTRKVMHEQAEPSRGKNCSFLHLIALKFIGDKEPLMKELAEFLGTTAPSATSLINTLISSELVLRKADEQDRRIVRITLSKKGQDFLEVHKQKIAAKMRLNLSKLSLDEQEQLEKILEKINR